MSLRTGRGDWTTDGVFEEAPGVYRIPLPLPSDGLRAVNVYVLEASGGPVLIDSGWAIAEARERLVRGLRHLGVELADVRHFLVTHAHRDHFEQAITLRREFGTTVSLGAGEREALEALQIHERHPFEPQLQLLAEMGAGAVAEEITKVVAPIGTASRENWQFPDVWLDGGTVSVHEGRELAVIPTPGHTVGHVVFHDWEHALLFAGDHVLPSITPSVGFQPVLSPTALGDFLESLARVRRLPDALLLPAHGPVAPSVHARVDDLLEHHDVRLQHVVDAVNAGAETGFDVTTFLRWTRRERRLDELDPFNQLLAVTETAAHLDLLVAQARLRVTTEGGVHRYEPN